MSPHSHSTETPAPTTGKLIPWVAYYDTMVNCVSLGQAHRLRELTIQAAQITPGDSVLDVAAAPAA